MGLTDIDPTVMTELLGGMAKSMIPMLKEQLQSVQIPAVNEQIGKKIMNIKN